MDYAVPLVRHPLQGRARVPPSKSILQRALVLSALGDQPVSLDTHGQTPSEDVRATRDSLHAVGQWQGAHWGPSRDRKILDLRWNATGFRFLMAAACLRPPGSRTLVRGRPELLRRPHRALRRSLTDLGAHVVRRPSGAMRILAKPLRGGRVAIDGTASNQYASALALIAPRLGGLSIDVSGPVVSLPYLRITVQMLRQFDIEASLETTASSARLDVSGGVPARPGETLQIEPDASAAAAWFAAAAYVGGSQSVEGLRYDSAQADAALFDILARMGARIDEDADGWCRVTGTGERLRAAGRIDLQHATDLVPLVGALAASADGETWVVGAGHARRKESDRLARVAQNIVAMGGEATLEPDDVLHIRGRSLHGAVLDVHDDHRLAFGFGVLGLRVPGVTLRGAESTAKSDPGFLAGLDRAAMTAT